MQSSVATESERKEHMGKQLPPRDPSATTGLLEHQKDLYHCSE